MEERVRIMQSSKWGEYPASEDSSPSTLRKIAEWKSHAPFNDEYWFNKRLQLAGIDERGLNYLLEQNPDHLRERSPTPPKWLTFLLQAFGEHATSTLLNLAGCYFTPLFAPLLDAATATAKGKIEELALRHKQAPFDKSQADQFITTGLAAYLDSLISRTAVLELKIASLEKRLEGNTPEERFLSFVNSFRDPKASLSLLADYPVLGRVLAQATLLEIDSKTEFLERLCADWDHICSTFSIESTDVLETISGGLGDRHAGGRSVLLASMKSGKRLIYKPRSLAIDECFSNILSWLREKGGPRLRIPKVLTREDYGWAEFITTKACTSREEIARFYERQGSFVALFYALEGNDFHRENLIAHGEHPVPIDLESLCKADFGLGDPSIYNSPAAFKLNTSVLQTGLLPQLRKSKNGVALDFSGLGGQGGQQWHVETPAWEKAGTDEMILTRRQQEVSAADNQPVLNGKNVNPLDYSECILNGFESTYRLILAHRSELLTAKDSPIQAFASAETRTIFRVTQLYSMLLSESTHPDVLRDALDRDRLFDKIWHAIERNPLAEKALRIIPYEQRSLWLGDIPCFRNNVDSLEVKSNGEPVSGALTRSGLDAVRARLDQMDEHDLAHQEWIIRSSLAALEMETEGRMPHYKPRQTPLRYGQARLYEEATAVGNHLVKSAIRKNRVSSWIGLSIAGSRWTLRPLSLDLYSGLPGIALFLALLGKIRQDHTFSEHALDTVNSIREQLKKVYNKPQQVGGFEGWGGLIYTWTQLAALWADKALLEEAYSWLDAVAKLARLDNNLDVIGGSAGGILALLKFWQASHCDLALSLAIQMGDWLLERSQPASAGVGWVVPTDPEGPLTGFSHGASGMAYALFKLGQATGIKRFTDLMMQALAFEASEFSEKEQNWFDLRGNRAPGSRRDRFMTAWCHGATGIGLCRLRMMRNTDDPQIRKDVASAIRSTSKNGFGRNHSLCHGDLGSIELFLEASRSLRETSHSDVLTRKTAQIIASIEDAGWLCGVPKGIETPGLMNGLAGIGYGLLRLAAPDEVPSVLLLD